MDSIIEQLRLGGRDDEHWYEIGAVAADRIEALEAALREILKACDAGPTGSPWMADLQMIARAALDKDAELKASLREIADLVLVDSGSLYDAVRIARAALDKDAP